MQYKDIQHIQCNVCVLLEKRGLPHYLIQKDFIHFPKKSTAHFLDVNQFTGLHLCWSFLEAIFVGIPKLFREFVVLKHPSKDTRKLVVRFLCQTYLEDHPI